MYHSMCMKILEATYCIKVGACGFVLSVAAYSLEVNNNGYSKILALFKASSLFLFLTCVPYLQR